MKMTSLFIALLIGVSLSACDKTTADKTPETIVLPVPIAGPAGAKGDTGEVGEKGSTGRSGDEGIEGKPSKAGDEGIQGEPSKPENDTNIVIPPPVVEMPPEIVPEPSSVKTNK